MLKDDQKYAHKGFLIEEDVFAADDLHLDSTTAF